MDNRMVDIMTRVEMVRTGWKLSKTEFAGRIGMGPQTYSNYVTLANRPSMHLILEVCEKYQVSPNWLLLDNPPMFRTPQIGFNDNG